MKIRIVDRNNDWVFGWQNSSYADGANAVAIDIKLALQEWFGDCFFALQNGIPWKTRLGSHNQKDLLDNDIYEVVINRNGVLAIQNFESQVIDRRYRATFSVVQAYSTELLDLDFTMRI